VVGAGASALVAEPREQARAACLRADDLLVPRHGGREQIDAGGQLVAETPAVRAVGVGLPGGRDGPMRSVR